MHDDDLVLRITKRDADHLYALAFTWVDIAARGVVHSDNLKEIAHFVDLINAGIRFMQQIEKLTAEGDNASTDTKQRRDPRP